MSKPIRSRFLTMCAGLLFISFSVAEETQGSCKSLKEAGVTLGETLVDITVAHDEFVVLTNFGNLIASSTGEVWRYRGRVVPLDHDESWSFSSLASNGQELLVAENGARGGLYRQGDNGVWTKIVEPEPDRNRFTVRSNGVDFVALSTSYLVRTEGVVFHGNASGQKWTEKSINSNAKPLSIGSPHNAKMYLSVARSRYLLSLPRIEQSQDGVTWQEVSTAADQMPGPVAWNGKLFVKGSDLQRIYFSADGKEWKKAVHLTHDESSIHGGINDILWAGDQFVAVGGCAIIMRSKGGTEWSSQVGPMPEPARPRTVFDSYGALAVNGTNTVAVGQQRASDGGKLSVLAALSRDGVNWVDISAAVGAALPSKNK